MGSVTRPLQPAFHGPGSDSSLRTPVMTSGSPKLGEIVTHSVFASCGIWGSSAAATEHQFVNFPQGQAHPGCLRFSSCFPDDPGESRVEIERRPQTRERNMHNRGRRSSLQSRRPSTSTAAQDSVECPIRTALSAARIKCSSGKSLEGGVPQPQTETISPAAGARSDSPQRQGVPDGRALLPVEHQPFFRRRRRDRRWRRPGPS
jgi:hypothetical protein